jgi:thiamine-monophosphate kinase
MVKARFLSPTARVTIGREIAARALATAMIDVSDGLLQDLGHLCEESRVGAAIDASALNLSPAYCTILGEWEWSLALTGGEDYELLFSVEPEHCTRVMELAEQSECSITRIGKVVPQAEGIRVNDPDGNLYTPLQAGYDHFRQT